MWTRREKPRLESVLPAVRINEGHHLRYVEGNVVHMICAYDSVYELL